MSFLEKLILGLIGSELIEDAERFHNQRVQEREKRRYDSLYWQESIRDNNPRHDFDYDNMDD